MKREATVTIFVPANSPARPHWVKAWQLTPKGYRYQEFSADGTMAVDWVFRSKMDYYPRLRMLWPNVRL